MVELSESLRPVSRITEMKHSLRVAVGGRLRGHDVTLSPLREAHASMTDAVQRGLA
jgi:hypothetical protein